MKDPTKLLVPLVLRAHPFNVTVEPALSVLRDKLVTPPLTCWIQQQAAVESFCVVVQAIQFVSFIFPLVPCYSEATTPLLSIGMQHRGLIPKPHPSSGHSIHLSVAVRYHSSIQVCWINRIWGLHFFQLPACSSAPLILIAEKSCIPSHCQSIMIF